MELVGEVLVFKEKNLHGKIKAEHLCVVKKELEICDKPTLKKQSTFCSIYETDRYRIIYDLVKGSSVCFHAANLYKIDLF